MNKLCVSFIRLLVVAITLLSGQLLTSCNKIEEQTAHSIQPTTVEGRLYFPNSSLYTSTKNELIKMSDKQRVSWSHSYKHQTWYPKQFKGPQFYDVLLNDKGEVQVGNMIVKIKDGYVYNIPTNKAKLLADIDAGIASPEIDSYKETFGTPIPIEVGSSNNSETQPNARPRNKAERAAVRLIPGLYKQYYQMRWAMVLYEYEENGGAFLQLELWLQATDTRYPEFYFRAGDACNLEINNTGYSYQPYNSTQFLYKTEPNVSQYQGSLLARPLNNVGVYTSNGGTGNFGIKIDLRNDFKAYCPAIPNSTWNDTFFVRTF